MKQRKLYKSQTVGRPNKTYVHKGPMINQKASWIAVSVWILNHYQISPQNNSGMQKCLPWLVPLGLDWPASSICFRGAFWISPSFSNKIWTRWHSLIRVSALCIAYLKIFEIRIGIIAPEKSSINNATCSSTCISISKKHTKHKIHLAYDLPTQFRKFGSWMFWRNWLGNWAVSVQCGLYKYHTVVLLSN